MTGTVHVRIYLCCQGDAVSLFDGKSTPEYTSSSTNGGDDEAAERALRRRSLPDVSMELEAVSFFQV